MTLLRLPSGTVVNLDQVVMYWPLSDTGTRASLQLVLHAPVPRDVDEILALYDEDAIALDAMLHKNATAPSTQALAAVHSWQQERDRLRAKRATSSTAGAEVPDDIPF